jgi:predicted GNAT family acetyltransferase
MCVGGRAWQRGIRCTPSAVRRVAVPARNGETMEHEKPQVTVTRVDDKNRLEAYVDGRLAGLAEYIPARGLLAFVHTEVLPEHEGQGIGSALAKASLEMVRRADLKFLPVCPFIEAYADRHREFEPWRYRSVSRVSD